MFLTHHPDSFFFRLLASHGNRTQLNAYPPKPQSNVDLFTSYVYGDEAVTVTLVIKTYEMLRGDETPNLNVELFLAPPATM